ncbi:Glycosyl transferase family 2 [Roseovarius sp. EC-HK134]|uniref:glycosyltransferase family 2 protein n=1 Tax=unclassified Roseovarius TaxID=2614913 RepID=UPI001256D606|nr:MULTISPECIES: glycosyltransferase family 2 protein [unclassified Roseovarius]VVT29082.1 Glycosyl transferase family 2 [Roseovarius sp. EC-HK134]VVT30213.1 Glycosyl transferase family 2 [Roseovarius sp. EC-SD190]
MNAAPNWGVVATIKAPTRDILTFAAHHLDLGAHRVHIYLDAPDPQAEAALRAHPKCRVILCDDDYWNRRSRKGRPDKHQPRQSLNATHCLNKRPQVDWLAHIDVDEFLWSETPIADRLARVAPDRLSARVRPIEALDPGPYKIEAEPYRAYKSCALSQVDRRAQTNAIYPTYGPYLNGGFLSHVAGKVFVRTGQPDISLRIHNAFRNKVMDDEAEELHELRLCHHHAATWDHWLAAYRYRLSLGSYRAELKPAPHSDGYAFNMHEFFHMLEEDGGEPALRHFFSEVCTATPDLQKRLASYGHLHHINLDLDAKRARHFPEHS